MTEKVLLVDDEQNILDGYRRSLRKKVEIDVAPGGAEGLRAVEENGPYAVIISDFKMPEMNGMEFLMKAREVAPDTVRMMLTGHADLEVSMEATNAGNIFRFLTKPCPPEHLIASINDGIRQYKLITAEHELLEKTLRGSVKVLTDILSLTNPAAFGRASRVRRIMRELSEINNRERAWEFELAGMLSQTGCATLPLNIIEKVYRGDELDPEEVLLFETHPRVGYDLLVNIPRLESVAEIILYQQKQYNGEGPPHDDSRKREHIPVGARALHLALDYDTLAWTGHTNGEAYSIIKSRNGNYDPQFVEALDQIVNAQENFSVATQKVDDLLTEMVLAEDIRSDDGQLLAGKGQAVTESVKARLRNFARTGQKIGEVKVLVQETGSLGFTA